MRLPTAQGTGALRAIVRTNTTTYTVDRPSGQSSKEAMGEQLQDDRTSSVSADMWLMSPSEMSSKTEFGERLTGGLRGLAMPSEDIQTKDRVEYQGEKYEVAEVIHLPDSNPQTQKTLKAFGLEKMVNA